MNAYIFLLYVRGWWRMLCDHCPECGDHLPEQRYCPVCMYFGRVYPVTRVSKQIWWIRFKGRHRWL